MAESGKQEIWVERLASWSHSGLNRRAWCGKQGLNVHTFDYWRRRLRDAPALRKRTSLVPIVLTAPVASVPLELLLPGGICLRVPSGADVAQAAALVRALGAC